MIRRILALAIGTVFLISFTVIGLSWGSNMLNQADTMENVMGILVIAITLSIVIIGGWYTRKVYRNLMDIIKEEYK